MPAATNASGTLQKLQNCYIEILGSKIDHYILPDIGDSKGASYSDETIIGRAFP